MDFGIIKSILKRILDEFDHAYLNDVKSLQGMNPTSENLARLIFDRMAKELEQQPATVLKWKSANPNAAAWCVPAMIRFVSVLLRKKRGGAGRLSGFSLSGICLCRSQQRWKIDSDNL